MRGIRGCGVGLRAEFLEELAISSVSPDWLEITPENWFEPSYEYLENFEKLMQSYPVVAHGVSLSIGSIEAPDTAFLDRLKEFLDRYKIEHYSEHISFSALAGKQTYELLPLPMTKAMVEHLACKIDEVQDRLERPLILENSSYYISPYSEMREVDFICEVLERSGARLLLDVNNVYVNAVNHSFDAREYIAQIPPQKVAYMHIAGHLEYEEENLLLDTHGEAVCDDVWELLADTLKTHRAPVMIERDNNVPPWSTLVKEYQKLCEVVGSAS
jgi:uncharacterized protein (UPF0276 family)